MAMIENVSYNIPRRKAQSSKPMSKVERANNDGTVWLTRMNKIVKTKKIYEDWKSKLFTTML